MSQANDIAKYFVDVALGKNAKKSDYGRSNKLAASLLKDFTKDEIVKVIDYLVYVKRTKMYSFGYVSTVINEVLETLNHNELASVERDKMNDLLRREQEVTIDNATGERNRNKAGRLGTKPRFGKELDLNLFEGE